MRTTAQTRKSTTGQRVGLKLQTGLRAGIDPALTSGNYRVSDALRGSATNLVGPN